ncbi:MAG: helix-turn-helix transcriptional regulator [Verrucomicrobia bacterium]|nr:helix-turn-helix transcriptional regulator [Verrucomicrobiota bacterium]
MNSTVSISTRFREARERAGLSHDEAACMMGISGSHIWDIETHEDEIGSNYSVADVQRFCGVLGIQPRYLFGFEMVSPPLSSNEIAVLVRQHCRLRGITIAQFEEAAGWSVAKSLDDPARFRHDYSIDGIMNICRELEVDWHRFMESQ